MFRLKGFAAGTGVRTILGQHNLRIKGGAEIYYRFRRGSFRDDWLPLRLGLKFRSSLVVDELSLARPPNDCTFRFVGSARRRLDRELSVSVRVG